MRQKHLSARQNDGVGAGAPAIALVSAGRCFNCGLCTFCFKCYDFCPDLSIIMDRDAGRREIDLDHCKGCGICAEECPRGAIDWVREPRL